jgi:hypothetical protein
MMVRHLDLEAAHPAVKECHSGRKNARKADMVPPRPTQRGIWLGTADPYGLDFEVHFNLRRQIAPPLFLGEGLQRADCHDLHDSLRWLECPRVNDWRIETMCRKIPTGARIAGIQMRRARMRSRRTVRQAS